MRGGWGHPPETRRCENDRRIEDLVEHVAAAPQPEQRQKRVADRAKRKPCGAFPRRLREIVEEVMAERIFARLPRERWMHARVLLDLGHRVDTSVVGPLVGRGLPARAHDFPNGHADRSTKLDGESREKLVAVRSRLSLQIEE